MGQVIVIEGNLHNFNISCIEMISKWKIWGENDVKRWDDGQNVFNQTNDNACQLLRKQTNDYFLRKDFVETTYWPGELFFLFL